MKKIIYILMFALAMASCDDGTYIEPDLIFVPDGNTGDDIDKYVMLTEGSSQFLVFDRNAGVQMKGGALNYTNDEDHDDNKNSLFKGNYYTWSEAKKACPDGWRLPTLDELEVVSDEIKFNDGTAYLSDDDKKCYFPFSGEEDSPDFVHGFYWSSTERDSDNDDALLLQLNTKSSIVYGDKYDGFSVRCVKTVELPDPEDPDNPDVSDPGKSVPVTIGSLMVSDRNVGAKTGGVALNYTNDEEHADHKNSSFKGKYYIWSDAQYVCPSGWRLPSEVELNLISDKMKFSKGTAYLSDDDGNRCYFPLSGRSGSSSSVSGGYWSSAKVRLFIDFSSGASSGVTTANSSWGLSVRCVKTPLIVTTKDITNIGSTTATFNGSLSGDGDVTSLGFVYSETITKPTLDNASPAEAYASTGNFVANVMDLESSTKYYVRAYVTTSSGTSYGEVNTFTTKKLSLLGYYYHLNSSYSEVPNHSKTETGIIVSVNADNRSGMMITLEETESNWYEAKTYCNNLTTGGKSDWRLPSKDELQEVYAGYNGLQLVESGATTTNGKVNRWDYTMPTNSTSAAYDKEDFNNKLTAISGDAFMSSNYWSSSENNSNLSWYVSFNSGYVYYANKNFDYRVRCVRDF